MSTPDPIADAPVDEAPVEVAVPVTALVAKQDLDAEYVMLLQARQRSIQAEIDSLANAASRLADLNTRLSAVTAQLKSLGA